MKKLAIGFAALLFSTAAYASSVHLKGGKNAEPSFSDGGLYLAVSGALSGLGYGDVVISMEADADVYSTCTNPGSGAHQPPGQNPAPLTVTGASAIPADEVKNGNTPFAVTTIPPASSVAGAPDCPNTNWAQDIEDLAFYWVLITVEQPSGTTVLTIECDIDPASSDAPPAVSGGDVTCTQY